MNTDPQRCTLDAGILQFPVFHMRGGTSTGLVLAREDVPEDEARLAAAVSCR